MDFFARERGLTTWVEPFVGGANMIEAVPSTYDRIGYDLNPHVIRALLDIRDNAEGLPEYFTAQDRAYWRDQPPQTLKSWACIVTSFGADLNGGYAREKGSDETTFCGYGKRNALKQSQKIQNVEFICDSYENLTFKDCLIYCDPPYQNTSGYKTGAFNHDVFFEWCRGQAKENLVFVSEYAAPDDFVVVWEGAIKTNFSSSRTSATHTAVERLFLVIDSAVNTK